LPDLTRLAIRRRLAAELRRLREDARLSADAVAAGLGWSSSKISRIETYRTGVKDADLAALLDLYGVDDRQRARLMALAGKQERGWWATYSDALPEDFGAYISLESEAVSVQCWSPAVIHGLLQTEDYAREVIDAHAYSTERITRADLQRRVEARMRRQEIMTRPEPANVTFVLDEAVLLRRIGSPVVMRGQLARLLEWSTIPSVTLQVLALAGTHPIGTGGFAILQFAPVHGTALDDFVYVEQLVRHSYVENQDEAMRYQIAYNQLVDAALDPEASAELIARAAGEHWT
jgi:transcriptional regulator with XRE-family HTH domain